MGVRPQIYSHTHISTCPSKNDPFDTVFEIATAPKEAFRSSEILFQALLKVEECDGAIFLSLQAVGYVPLAAI